MKQSVYELHGLLSKTKTVEIQVPVNGVDLHSSNQNQVNLN